MTEKEKINEPCKYRGCSCTIKYGKHKNGKQRYFCHQCKKHFTSDEGWTGDSRANKKFLSMLLGLLKAGNCGKHTLQQARMYIDDDIPVKYLPKDLEGQEISCENPSLLICEDSKNTLTMYWLKDTVL